MSPVIGIVLLLAITVLLAATAATFFLDFDDGADRETPTVAFEYDFGAGGSGHTLVISHAGGDTVATESVVVVVSGATSSGPGDPNGRYQASLLGVSHDEMMAGMTMRVSAGKLGVSDLDLSEAEVRVIWISEGGSSNTLTRWTGPSY